MTTNQAIASNDNNASTASARGASQQGSDYINHYLAGDPIIYIYRITEWVDKKTGAITWFYKGNMKTGPKKGDIYIPVEGSLSDNALEVLEPVIDLLDADDASMQRSIGATCKTPRFEGVSAFVPKGETEPVGVARFRINFIKNTRLFKKGKKMESSDQSATPVDPNAQGGDPGFSDADIPH